MKETNRLPYKARILTAFFGLLCATSLGGVTAGCRGTASPEATTGRPDKTETGVRGAMNPQEALEYMKRTSNLVIVDVAARRWYSQEHFEGAVNIPIEELSSEEEKELYLKLPEGRPVLLHCRLGMIVPGAYKILKQLRPDIEEISYIDGRPLFSEYNDWKKEQASGHSGTKKFLGGLTPSEALAYMKQTPGLYIIDVREKEWYDGFSQFTGNEHIPRSLLAARYKEIPTDRPVIINCGAGVQAPRAYEFLKEQDADILQLSYIDGTPLFQAYNEWVASRNK